MGTMNRAHLRVIGALVAAAIATTSAHAKKEPSQAPFDFDDVIQKAQHLSGVAWQEPASEVPDWLLKITYDQWRDIRFRPERALWRDKKLPFQVQFFHPGLYYNRVVKAHVVQDGKARPYPFSPNLFDYGLNDFASRVPQDLGFAGLRVHYPIKTKDYYDEVIVFLGATYFRSLGRDEAFGLSARGLAVDTAASWGEEFPYFREFWLVEPPPGAHELTIYALLDSQRVTGAYRFTITPGEQTMVKVDLRLFLRKPIEKLGIGGLTSMFFHGENTVRSFVDFRPEVHDSDGLVLHMKSGEWLWRPLDNPKTLSLSSFASTDVDGFGLVQRDRSFDSYQDLETHAERRPSAWVMPEGTWGPGHVDLVEIPTTADINDNIVAYWVPERKPAPGEPIGFSYRMYWYGDDPTRPPGGRVIATRRDNGTHENVHRLVIDFAGKQLAAIPADQVVRGVVTVLGGDGVADLLDQEVVKNPFTGGWRLSFQVRPKKKDPIELRAFLDQGGTVLTETWSYALLP
jgi:glucans biosynthesis protein